mmetsp:Transcript_2802/g.4347  ORF Transcript_2802/g.4347 Transcript_2802/m.4347 type:complete len:288 (-) Transcript_2802:678-1541(-)
MIDRFQEFKILVKQPSHEVDLQAQSHPFMLRIKEAQKAIERVNKNSQQIKHLESEFNKSATPEQELNFNKQMKQIVQTNKQDLNSVRDTVESLGKELEEEKTKQGEVECRMHVTMHATLAKQFQEALRSSEKAQDNYYQAVRKKTANQLRMVDENIPEEVIEQCMENPQQAQQIVNSKMMGAHTEIIRMVHSIEERLEDIKMLEQNVNIMHRMFLDLAALVHSQGEILNSIEKHVDNATNYVEKGVNALEEAKKHQQSSRWKKCCLLVVLLVILLVIVIPTISLTAF